MFVFRTYKASLADPGKAAALQTPLKIINWFIKSMYEEAPTSGFHPCDKSDNFFNGFPGPPRCNEMVDPDRYVSCDSCELLFSSVANQMN